MEKKYHLTNAGLLQIINIKASFKKGLNSDLIAAFSNYKPVIRPLYSPNLANMSPE
jgi:hypothetical protein